MMCVCMTAHICHNIHVEVKRQLSGATSLSYHEVGGGVQLRLSGLHHKGLDL